MSPTVIALVLHMNCEERIHAMRGQRLVALCIGLATWAVWTQLALHVIARRGRPHAKFMVRVASVICVCNAQSLYTAWRLLYCLLMY